MRKTYLFMMISVDGYFEDANHNIGWHNVDSEFNDFAIKQLENTDTLLFGKTTYELMASYWPTPEAKNDDSVVATFMNTMQKFVISTTLTDITWENTTQIHTSVFQEVKNLKQKDGKDIGIFGSAKLATSLLEHDLLDEIRLMIAPVLLGAGTSIFAGLPKKESLHSEKVVPFISGNTLHIYTLNSRSAD